MLWIKNPKTGKPDTMLTIAIYTTIIVLGKFLLNGVQISSIGLNFGSIDATTIAAMLTPTLGSYVMRRYTDMKFQNNQGENNVENK